MRVYLCDLCKKEIHERVYRINIVAFPSADPPESARALDDDWANEIRKMDLCYECLTDALRGENDTPEKIEGGVQTTHSGEPVQEPEPQPEPADDDSGELTEEEEQAICDRIAGKSPKKSKKVDEDLVMRMRAEKRSAKAISEELGCHISTVYNILRRREGNLFQGTEKGTNAMAIAMKER